jgi:hypothetical protein
MAENGSLTPISEAEYETIEAAVMETARGRWFLSEFARRNRNADTTVLLDAISRLEQAMTGERAAPHMEQVRLHLVEMSKAISRTKDEIAAMQSSQPESGRLTAASESLDAIVRTTERATSDILEAAEHIQEAAWTLREAGADEKLCNELDQRATHIYAACSFQDLTAQRTGKVVNALRYLEGRIEAMIDIWVSDDPGGGGHRAVGARDELSQGDVDTVIINEECLIEAADDERPSPFAAQPATLVREAPVEIGFVDARPALPRPGLELAGEDIEVIDHAPPLRIEAAAAAGMPSTADVGPAAQPGAAEIGRAPLVGTGPSARLAAFAEIEALGTREKLRRFT